MKMLVLKVQTEIILVQQKKSGGLKISYVRAPPHAADPLFTASWRLAGDGGRDRFFAISVGLIGRALVHVLSDFDLDVRALRPPLPENVRVLNTPTRVGGYLTDSSSMG
jgi:hypothetical protein